MLVAVEAAGSLQMQRFVCMVVVIHVLGMHDHVCHLVRALGHCKRTGHANGLPQEGNQQ